MPARGPSVHRTAENQVGSVSLAFQFPYGDAGPAVGLATSLCLFSAAAFHYNHCIMDGLAKISLLTSAAQRRAFARRLVAWFRRQARDLPWRKTRDLYAIWVSEVMLQQTQVQTVIPYYHRFLQEFADVRQLAAADEQQVLRLWEGLGYYRRARQMHAAARKIVAEHGGRFPTSYAAVRGLPGIGRYTAGAILSIGRDERLPILEANTIRVLSRLSAFRGDVSSTAGQKHLWSLAEAILPARESGAFNQALMELGSELCTPKSPDCISCPVAVHCRARAEQIVDRVPAAARRTIYEDLHEIAVIVRHGRRVLLRKCQPSERWAGLWDFPRYAGPADALAQQVKEQTGVPVLPGEKIATFKHGVTRFRITLACYEAQCAFGSNGAHAKAPNEIRWVTHRELALLPLSTTGRKLAQLAARKQNVTRRTSPIAVARRVQNRHTPA
jgi:A/G-specific adenine glycosylase